jgi:hypothetical protein
VSSDELRALTIERVMRPMPDGVPVVPWSTVVPAFGDPGHCRIATLGLNPSGQEFGRAIDGVFRELPESERRFETLTSLGVGAVTDPSVAGRVVTTSDGYFRRRPYLRWFGALERVLTPLGASYGLAGAEAAACHLDLAQWATDPVWGDLEASAQTRLIEDGREFLQAQLRIAPIELLLINGAGALRTFNFATETALTTTMTVPTGRGQCRIYRGRVATGQLVIGWSTNLQSSWGVTTAMRSSLVEAVSILAVQ